MDALTKWEGYTAIQVYGTSESVDKLLDAIQTEARNYEPEPETTKGRKDIASRANKVARLKVYLDGLGKELVSDWKQRAKAVDVERKKIRDRLDVLKGEVRKPLTDWETAEQARQDAIKAKLDAIEHAKNAMLPDGTPRTLDSLRDSLAYVLSFRDFAEFGEHAATAGKGVIESVDALRALIEQREKEAAEKAELERLRQEEEARKKAKHEEVIWREAAAQAKREAEEAARAVEEAASQERERLVREKREAVERAEREKQEAIDRAELAKLEAELAAKRERERIEEENRREAAEAEKRKQAERVSHAMHDAVVEALSSVCRVETETAECIARAISDGKIPHVMLRF